jgi:UrcA family protein
MSVSKSVIFTAACAIAAAAVAGSAMAQGEGAAARSIFQQVSVPVTYADLDLSSPDGAQTMLHRLHDAALNACGAGDGSVTSYKWAVHRSACYHRSMGQALADLGAPAVTQLYQAHAAYASN